LGRWGRELGVEQLVCTHKDLVKLAVPAVGGVPLAALRVGVEVDEGLADLEARLTGVVPRTP
jgi:hypothetical protein